MPVNTKKKVIFDTDAGIDDCMALIFGLRHPNIEIIAITTCFGNTYRKNVDENVKKILQIMNHTHIPIYFGAEYPLNQDTFEVQAANVHGNDGFGDVDWTNFEYQFNTLEHKSFAAHEAIVSLTKEHNDVTVVAIGPLTNVAKAIELDATVVDRCSLYCMGGSVERLGNTSDTAEHNFFVDALAAHQVLASIPKTILITWELTLKHKVSLEIFNQIRGSDTVYSKFIRAITLKFANFVMRELDANSMVFCDLLAMMALAEPSIILEKEDIGVDIEIDGITSGSCLINDSKQNIINILSFNQEFFDDLCLKYLL
eukprot:TRINITY_DN840_c0_g1_i1.p1 TRINITY_DN840_c0_g1~~TRINITY_DN840_c0_g1_i1.p1  ORF type:complete len:325 (-),score=99.71 TRINITY_DN840_c0_g1_i1:55-993(-)